MGECNGSGEIFARRGFAIHVNRENSNWNFLDLFRPLDNAPATDYTAGIDHLSSPLFSLLPFARLSHIQADFRLLCAFLLLPGKCPAHPHPLLYV